MCGENDSIERAFLECQSFLKLCDESLQLFNNLQKSDVGFFWIYQPQPPAFLINKQRICVFFRYAKQYNYESKTMQKKVDTSEFISKLIIHLKIGK